MTVRYLQEQAERAERLARGVLDALACEALMKYARECRERADVADSFRNGSRHAKSPDDWVQALFSDTLRSKRGTEASRPIYPDKFSKTVTAGGLRSFLAKKLIICAASAKGSLLRVLRVKGCLLSLHPLNQMVDPIKGWLICDPGRHHTIMLDFAV